MRLPVQRFGDPDGRELVCLHGLAGYGARFRRLAELLPGRLLVCPDLRGHGEAGREPPWDTATHVEDVAETRRGRGRDGRAPTGWASASAAACLPRFWHGGAQAAERVCLLDPALSLPAALCQERAASELAGETFGSPDEAIEAELASGLLHRTPRELLEEEMELNLVERPDGRFEYRYSREMAIAAWSEMAREPPPVADLPDTDRDRRALVDSGGRRPLPGGARRAATGDARARRALGALGVARGDRRGRARLPQRVAARSASSRSGWPKSYPSSWRRPGTIRLPVVTTEAISP